MTKQILKRTGEFFLLLNKKTLIITTLPDPKVMCLVVQLYFHLLSILGKSYTMFGEDNSTQSLGIVPCAISWLFKLINERKEKTGTRFSIRVSAVEISGKDENLKDLLAEVATGSLQDGQSPGVYLREDPICGTQV